jgi:DNA-binding transcriptional LysR family regulator
MLGMTQLHASTDGPPRPYEALADLRVFCEVVARGSFTAAADAVHYTQSGVSRRIAALERATGGALFARGPRGVHLTPAGELLHRHALDVLGRAEATAEEIAALRRGTGGRLRIGSFATANAVLVPAALAAFRRAVPAVETSVSEALTAALLASLRGGDLDVAVVSDYPSGTVPADGVEFTPLCDDPLLVALPPGHPLADAPAVDLRDLAGESWIEAGPHRGDTVLATVAGRAGFVPRTDITVPGWTAKQGFVAAGLGVTLVPTLAAPAMRPDLVLRPVADELARRRVFVATPAGADRLSAASAFTDALREQVPAPSGSPASRQRGRPTSGRV